MTIGGDRPPKLGDDVVTFEDMRELLVAYSEYEQEMHITNQDGGDRLRARRRELVDSATQMMVTDEFYNDKPWVDLSEEELMQGLKRFAGVDVQKTRNEDFCRQIFRELRMDASVPVDGREFVKKRALRKYLADSGLTEVVRPDGRQYTLRHSKVLVEAIAAGIEPLEFRREVETCMRYEIVTHDPDSLFNIIAKQQRDQAVVEANDAERRQTAKQRDSRSMAAAGTKPQGRAVDEHDSRENAKAAGVKTERNRRYDNNECFVCGKSRNTSGGIAPKASRARRGKASMARPTARPLYSSSSPQAVPLSIPGARQSGWPLRLPPFDLVRTRPPLRRWLRRPNMLRLNHLGGMTTTSTFACRGKGWRQ